MIRSTCRQLLFLFAAIFALVGCLAQYRGRYVTLFYADDGDARRLGSLSDGEMGKPVSLRYSGKVVFEDVRETDTLSDVLTRQAKKNGWDDVDKYNFKFEMLINRKPKQDDPLEIKYPMQVDVEGTEEKQTMKLTLSRNDSLMRFAKDSPLNVFTLGWDEEMGDCVAIYPYYHWLLDDESNSTGNNDPEPKGPINAPITEAPKKIYTIELYALGDYYADVPTGDVSWSRVFSARVREGDEASLSSLVSDAGERFAESSLKEWSRHPLWGLGDGRSYDISMLWVPERALGGRPSTAALAGGLMSGAFAGDSLEAPRRMEPSDEACWFHGQPDESGTLRFYASYMLNQKTWGVEFYALSSTGKWSLVSSRSGMAGMGDEDVEVDLPPVFDADVETPDGWWSPLNEWASDSALFDDLSLVPADDIAIVAKAVRGASADRTQAKLVLNSDGRTTRRLYARYRRIYVMELYALGDYYADVPTGDVSWSRVFSARVREGDEASLSSLVSDAGERFAESSLKEWSRHPLWGLGDGRSYDISMLWVPERALGGRPSTAALAGGLMSGAFAGDSLEAPRRMEPSDEACWFHGQPDESGTLRFYASYMLNQKTWGVEFYALSSTGKWSLVSSRSGMAGMGDEDVEVDLPPVFDADVETPDGWWSPLNEWASDSALFDDLSLVPADDIAIVAKAVRGASADRTQARFVLNAKSDTRKKLYARYEPEWVMDFHILDGEYESVKSDDEIKWAKIASKRLKPGDRISVDNVLVQEQMTIPEKLSEMLASNQKVRPIWGTEDGNRYSNAMMWKSVPSDADMSVKANADAFFVSRAAKKIKDFSDFWDFQPVGWKRDYNSKPEVQSFSPEDFNVSETGRRISMYPAYLELDEIKTVFYVVSSFAQEKFTWSAYEYADSADKAGYSVHEVPAGALVPDPNMKREVSDLESDALASGSGKLEGGAKNILVFKGWRRIDPKTEFNQNAIDNKSMDLNDYFNVSDESNANGILYDCACQRAKKISTVEKPGYYWDEGSFTSSKADSVDPSVPQIYVAVYEYRQCVCGVFTRDPEYSGVEFAGDFSYASGKTDPQSRLRQVELVFSSGAGWDMSVIRMKYGIVGGVLSDGSSNDLKERKVGVGVVSGDARSLDVSEKNASNEYVSLFKSVNSFECVVWWITNPSGYEFPFAFYTKADENAIFTMPTTSHGAPSYSP